MIFAIVGDGGFAINSNIRQFLSLINTPYFNNVVIKSFESEGAAYSFSCQAYDDRTKRNWACHPPLPKLDTVMAYGGIYYNPEFVPKKIVVQCQRYFGVISENGFGVTDNFLDIVEFIETYVRYECRVLESPDLLRSLEDFSELYENQRMAMSAYVQEPLILPGENEINKIFLDYPLINNLGFYEFKQLSQMKKEPYQYLQNGM